MGKENTPVKEVTVTTVTPKEGTVILKDDIIEPGSDGEPNGGEYIPPVVDVVTPTDPAAPVEPTAPGTPAPGPDVSLEPSNSEADLDGTPSRVPGPDMVAVDGSAVTNIMLRRIEKHLAYLRGEIGFADMAAQRREQVDFMETVGESTCLEYDKFKIVTDALIRMIADNKELFRSGEALRFIVNLNGYYNQTSITRYIDYITYLTKIAVNWTNRSRLRQQTDIAIVVDGLRQVGKENVTMYFNSLVAAR